MPKWTLWIGVLVGAALVIAPVAGLVDLVIRLNNHGVLDMMPMVMAGRVPLFSGLALMIVAGALLCGVSIQRLRRRS